MILDIQYSYISHIYLSTVGPPYFTLELLVVPIFPIFFFVFPELFFSKNPEIQNSQLNVNDDDMN